MNSKQTDLSKKLTNLRVKWRKDGTTQDEWQNGLSKSGRKLNVDSHDNPRKRNSKRFILFPIIISIIGVLAYASYEEWDPKCIVSNNLFLIELSRPSVSCDVCQDFEQVPTVDGDSFTKEDFIKNFAYNGAPLLVKGGARNWTALSTFSFQYLKDLFENTEGALEAVEHDCQFFRYNTEFLNMADVFRMPEARSKFLPGEKQWYVGW